MGRETGHLSVATIGMAAKHTFLQPRRLQPGAIRVDLRDYLTEPKQFWWAGEVDRIIAVLERALAPQSICTEVHRRAHRGYEVLHVMPHNPDDPGCADEVADAVRRVVAYLL